MARGEASGSLLLGHIIPSLKDLDRVVNRDGPVPFPRDMRIQQTTVYDAERSTSRETGTNAGANAGGPIVAAPGISIRADVGMEFKKGFGSSATFERLDTQIIRPTKLYIRNCLKDPAVAEHIENVKFLGAWKLFMVTGIMIARGARTERSESRTVGFHFKPGVNVAEVVNTDIDVGRSRTTESKFAAQHQNDFIWAIRLMKISTSIFRSGVSERTFTKGATLSGEEDVPDIKAIAEGAGLEYYETSEFESIEGGEVLYFIMPKGA
ncbi:hypothetical protein CMUS01_12191 [Colletotrichum musicola]|uniref:Uncharacterized protein n=1 Tax=Colletotrichum musicola TaxID=2175873 RepID=A0A8H6N289_9PEZI|nr:hypothetical protein CMUS01_12191 [Colletotrichum musicola]